MLLNFIMEIFNDGDIDIYEEDKYLGNLKDSQLLTQIVFADRQFEITRHGQGYNVTESSKYKTLSQSVLIQVGKSYFLKSKENRYLILGPFIFTTIELKQVCVGSIFQFGDTYSIKLDSKVEKNLMAGIVAFLIKRKK